MGVDILGIGKSALDASKKSLSTASHNIANANTEGFSRQRVNLRTNTPIGQGNYVLGSGVNIRSIKRVHDELVEKRLGSSISNNQFDHQRSNALAQVEDIFNEVNSEGMNKLLNRFFNSFRELANQPDNETVRSVVRENARIVVGDFKRQLNSIYEITDTLNRSLDVSVTDINTLTHSIAKLNKEIASLEVTSQETGDLRDQRDQAVRTLAEYFKVKTYFDDKGQYIVSAENVGTIVSGAEATELQIGSTLDEQTGRGKVEIFLKGRPSKPITSNFRKGKIAAIYKTRETEIRDLTNKVNELAFDLAKATNAIHRKGFKNIALPTDQNGNPIINGREKVTDIDFFKEPTTKFRAAEYLELSDDVKSSLSNIVTGLAPNSPGDNRVAIGISKLQHQKLMDGGRATLEEHYLKSVGGIGLAAGKSKINVEQSDGLYAQAKSIRERISGVSIDEETANMMKYQQAYDASARVIKVADEMFKSVLSMVDR